MYLLIVERHVDDDKNDTYYDYHRDNRIEVKHEAAPSGRYALQRVAVVPCAQTRGCRSVSGKARSGSLHTLNMAP